MERLDTIFIRSGTEQEIAQYLRKLATPGNIENTTQQLIEAVERGSLAPSIFKIWFSVSHSPVPLKKALEQNFSVHTRKLAIEQLQKRLRSPKWRETWSGLGGVDGLLNLLQNSSSSDVQDLCLAIGSSTKGENFDKRVVITELYRALNSQTVDTRRLTEYYRYLVPGCTEELVADIVDKPMEDWEDRKKHLLLRNHIKVLRNSATKMVLDFDGPDRPWLFALMRDYPALAGTKPGFSSSMEFSLEILRKLVDEGEVSQISDMAFAAEIANPLLDRALKKELPADALKEIVNLIVKYIERYPSSVQHFSTFVDIGKCWLQMPDIFDKLFRLRIAKTTTGGFHFDSTRDAFHQLSLGKFEERHRYKIIKFYVKVVLTKENEAEITFDEGLRRTTGCFRCRSGSMPDLNPEETLDLFLRLRKARGDSIIDTTSVNYCYGLFDLGLRDTPAKWSSTSTDLDIWQVYFLYNASRHEEAEILARLRIAERKRAQSTPDTKLRNMHSKAVFYYATASGSLPILSEAVVWAKKLIRDPNIEIFSSIPLELLKILSGFRTKIDHDASALQARVHQANRIMGDMYDLACSAIQESGENDSHWRRIFEIFHRTIASRANRSPELRGKFSEDEIYEILWDDTLKLMLETEEKAFKDKERLALQERSEKPKGIWDPFGTYSEPINIDTDSPSACRFFDNLAKGRDEIWRKHRISKCPAVAELPAPFPQGLPVQYLIPHWNFRGTLASEDLAPYIASRIRDTLFISPEASRVAIPRNNEILANNLGLFVDDYEAALGMFLPMERSEQERRKALDSVWGYAIGTLSEGRLNPEEALRYWRRLFKHFLRLSFNRAINGPAYLQRDGEALKLLELHEFDLKWLGETINEIQAEPLVIPTQRGSYVIEWDVAPNPKDAIDGRELGELTYIDVSTHPRRLYDNRTWDNDGGREEDLASKLSVPKLPKRTYWSHPIWTRAKNSQAKSNYHLQEAQILSALLYLDAKTLRKTRLLPIPFPSGDDSRYPSIHLSSECVSKLDAIKTELSPARIRRERARRLRLSKASNLLNPSIKSALKALEAQISLTPPKLILGLAEDAFDNLGLMDPSSEEFLTLEALSFNLLALLAKSDRPELALELAIRSISKYPSACFWHKTVFTTGFFRNLAPRDAQDGMSKFAETVCEILEHMEKVKEARKMKATENTSTVEAPEQRAKLAWESVEKKKPEEAKDEPGFVKVSTIKLLIELFEDADYIAQESSLATIHKLCRATSSVDIQMTILYYLLRVAKSPRPLNPEFFSILSTLSNKNDDKEIHNLILEILNLLLRLSKLESRFVDLVISVISTGHKRTSDVGIQKQIIKYFSLAVDTPLVSDRAVQAHFLSIVSEMIKENIALDLRHALVAYLLKFLEVSPADTYGSVFEILKKLVSNCGNINEREPVTEEQWNRFDETLELPDCDVSGSLTESHNPILLRLVLFQDKIIKNLELNKLFTETIMIPIVKEFQSQSLRYFSIFLQVHGIDKSAQKGLSIPPMPKSIDFLNKIIQNGAGEEVLYFLEDYMSYIIFNISPPEVIKDLNKKFEDDPKSLSISTVRNWCDLYNKKHSVIDECQLISFIRKRESTPDEEKTAIKIRERFLRLYKALFWSDAEDSQFRNSNLLLGQLKPSPLDATWLKHIQLILHDALDFVNSIRTTEWINDSDREPKILPDTFPFQQWLLTIPSVARNGEDQETRCEVFAKEVSETIDQSSTSYMFNDLIKSIKKTLVFCVNDEEDDILVAIYLGDLTKTQLPSTTIQDYIRIGFANKILQGRSATKSTVLKEKTDAMVNSWKNCGVEEIRRLGYEAKKLKLEIPQPETAKEQSPGKREPRAVAGRPQPHGIGSRSRRRSKKNTRWGPLDLKIEKSTKNVVSMQDFSLPTAAWEDPDFVVNGWDRD